MVYPLGTNLHITENCQRQFCDRCKYIAADELLEPHWILSCRCYEDLDPSLYWSWLVQEEQSDIVRLSECASVITFHPFESSGTVVVRGSVPFSEGIHYWELKAISPVYGSDMMIGVGLADSDIPFFTNDFRSVLGTDSHSWGLSYRGLVMHSGQEYPCPSISFKRGSIIGCLLDLRHGELQFFVDNQTHSAAKFRNLPRTSYYPMVCSTASRSGFRLIRTMTLGPSLRLLVCRSIQHFAQNPIGNRLVGLEKLPPTVRRLLTTQLPWCLYFCSSTHTPRLEQEKSQQPPQSNETTVTTDSDPFMWISFTDSDTNQSSPPRSPPLFDDIIDLDLICTPEYDGEIDETSDHLWDH